MRKIYAFTILAFLFAGAAAVAENPVAVDGVGEMPAMAEQPEAVVCESLKSGLQNQGTREKTGTVSITKIEMIPPLSITAFGTYGVDVELTKDENVVINTVTLTTRPVVYDGIDVFTDRAWNYYTWGPPSDNESILRSSDENLEEYNFRGIRPDDIYPEIHFATDEITHQNPPINETIDQNNIQLMYFINPFDMGNNSSFFIEFYAEPKNPNPPPPVPLDVYLVGSGVVSTTFENSDWIGATNAELVGTIGRDDDFNHTHSEFSRHHVVFLSTDDDGNVAGLDVNDDFWIVLTAGTSQDRRSWNLKYHTSGDDWTCDNNGTWFRRSGTTVTQQTGCPDVHVHLARDQRPTKTKGALVDGVEHLVEVSYTFDGTITVIDDTEYYYFGEIDNLAPNASSFTGPLAGVYSKTFDITWNAARDPNNDPVTYNIYLYDIGTQTDVYTIETGHSGESLSFNTTPGTDPPEDGVYNIRIVACDDKGLCSSSFFLYDIYDIGEEFVIANDPFNWIGEGENSDWDNAANWNKEAPPGENDLAFILGSAPRDLVIGNDIDAKARRLSIEPGRTVTITAGGRLEVTQSLVNKAGPTALIVEPGASLIHNTPWPSEGVPATVKNHILGGGTSWSKNATAWYYIAAPVVDQNIAAAMTDAFGENTNATDFDLYRWSEANDQWINYHNTTITPTFSRDNFLSGEGYIFGAPNPVTLSLSGKLGSGDAVWENLTYSGQGNTNPDINPGDDGYFTAGWHLLGNPFPSGIVATDTWTFENIVHTPKIWNGSAYNDVYDGFIPANTAFFVQVVSNTFDGKDNTLTIPFSARAHNAPEPDKNTPQNRILLVAQAQDSEMRQQHVIRLEPDAAEGFDPRYDSRFMAGYAPQLFSITETDRLSTIAIPEITDDLVIPMVFRKNHEGENFLIKLERNIPNTELYLHDLKTDTWHKLDFDKPYTFTADDDDDPIRFELHFSPPEDDDGDDDPTSITEASDGNVTRMWYHNNRLYVQTNESGTRLTIYDINGRTLQTYRPEPGLQSYHITLPPGAYIARLNGNNTHKTLKIITTKTP